MKEEVQTLARWNTSEPADAVALQSGMELSKPAGHSHGSGLRAKDPSRVHVGTIWVIAAG